MNIKLFEGGGAVGRKSGEGTPDIIFFARLSTPPIYKATVYSNLSSSPPSLDQKSLQLHLKGQCHESFCLSLNISENFRKKSNWP